MRIDINQNLMIRPIEKGDAPEILELILTNEAHLKHWLPWVKKPITIHTMLSFIEMAERKKAVNEGFEWVILYKSQICGLVGLHHIDWNNRKTSIGYWLAEAYEGKGLVTRSVEAIVKMIFENLKLNRIEIFCAERNIRSRAIPERLLFRIEGVLREAEWLYDHYVDHVVYGMLRSDFEARRQVSGFDDLL